MDEETEGTSLAPCLVCLSRELRALHARLAALLGPSAAGRGDLRLVPDDLSPGLEDRRVVLMVCFSGLAERRPLSDFDGGLGDRDRPLDVPKVDG